MTEIHTFNTSGPFRMPFGASTVIGAVPVLTSPGNDKRAPSGPARLRLLKYTSMLDGDAADKGNL
jgi:hypothetical protein